ncbi:MAG: A/G-specific adenine glycosylase [Deltaproteobacteria bacterium]|nr:A/G-specific adenine glycosylase [Deltaproteobacteria bacterium]
MKPEDLSPVRIKQFRNIISHHYKKHGRDLAWRRTKNPYHILVSEVMLQQTQVERVATKYAEFIAAFPDFRSLAHASLQEVLRVWQGMGYNRRAVALREIAVRVLRDFDGKLPESEDALAALPGIGRATASSICAFAFNQPVVFIETNIRRVFIHFFFQDRQNVHDRDILVLVEKTLDRRSPREWYSALMDYGVLLKRQFPGINQKSAHYQKQTPFQGSNRQLRGRVLKALLQGPAAPDSISRSLMLDPKQTGKILSQLQQEGFVEKRGKRYTVAR